jgi:hypothetical protein
MSKPCIIVILLLSSNIFAQYYGTNSSIAFNAIYTTSSRLYLNTASGSFFERNEYVNIEGILSYSIEVKRRLTDELFIGLSIEKLNVYKSGKNVKAMTPNGMQRIVVDDGFIAYPVELSLYYIIPVSNESIILYIGGGAGYYSGEQLRQIGSSKMESKEKKIAWGIQVQTGLEYMITDYLSLKGEMRFRDPEFEMTNHYNEKVIIYRNQYIRLPEDDFDSKVNIDGISFMLGVVYYWSLF